MASLSGSPGEVQTRYHWRRSFAGGSSASGAFAGNTLFPKGQDGERVTQYGLDDRAWSELEREVVELFTALLRVDTTNPPGNETAVAEFMAAWFAEAGLHGEVVGEPADRRSFVLRVDGSRPGPSLLSCTRCTAPASRLREKASRAPPSSPPPEPSRRPLPSRSPSPSRRCCSRR